VARFAGADYKKVDTMSESNVRAQILSTLNGVTNVGKTYDYKRWAPMVNNFLNFFRLVIGGVQQIRTWEITGPTITQGALTFGGTNILRTYTYIINGFMGLNDSTATEKTFIAMAEDVVEALDADFHKGTTFHHCEPAELSLFAWLKFGETLCHHAQITLQVQEIVT
jgi:hypothetical protein